MDSYLIDRETLGKFVDELIKNKALPVSTAEELSAKREELIKSLDEKIGLAVLNSLTEEQGEEFDRLLDQDDGSAEPYQEFFQRAGLNIEKIITDAVKDFQAEVLGGENA